MKSLAILCLFLIFSTPLVSAYSFDEFLNDTKSLFIGFVSFTGMVVIDVREEKEDNEKFEKIKIPEPKKIEISEEVQKGETLTINEELEKEQPMEEKRKSSKKKKKVPVCSDYIDNNINYFKKGSCEDNTKKLFKEDYLEDYCNNDLVTLMEYSCSSEGTCEGSWYVCPNGCGDGACLSEKKEELEPDLKILSVSEVLGNSVVSVKNKGSKGTYFKTKSITSETETMSDINYYLEPDEIIGINLGKKLKGNYSVEIISEDDMNKEDNTFEGYSEEAIENPKVTGEIISKVEKEKENLFVKIIRLIKYLF